MFLLFIQGRTILAGKGQVASSSPLIGFSIGEMGGGGYPVETPPIFPSPQMLYDIAWLGQKKINWGYGFAFYSRKDNFDDFGRKSLQIQPFSTLNYIPPPLNFSIHPLTYSIALLCPKKSEFGGYGFAIN